MEGKSSNERPGSLRVCRAVDGACREHMGPISFLTRWADMDIPQELRAKAEKCRYLARGADERTRENLLMLAADCAAQAERLQPFNPAT